MEGVKLVGREGEKEGGSPEEDEAISTPCPPPCIPLLLLLSEWPRIIGVEPMPPVPPSTGVASTTLGVAILAVRGVIPCSTQATGTDIGYWEGELLRVWVIERADRVNE